MVSALGWGALAASSLLVGALLGIVRRWPDRLVGLVLAFGAGALISSVSFELAEAALDVGPPAALGVGLAAGALSYYAADGVVEQMGGRGGGGAAGGPLALGALLDGIPEQAVLGIGIAAGDGVSVALLVAIFVSNLPEAIGSASEMRGAGKSRGMIVRLWSAVVVVCALATVGGYALADAMGGTLKAGIDGFAAGALVVLLVDSMIPEAASKAGRTAGLVTTLGFAVAAGISNVS
jgi:zinc transporter, ZIP family